MSLYNNYEEFLAACLKHSTQEEYEYTMNAYTYSKKLSEKYYDEFMDLSDEKQRERYNKIIKLITSKNYIKYGNDAFLQLDFEKITKLFLYILNNIFGDLNKIEKEIELYLKSIQIRNGAEPMDGQAFEIVNTDTGEKFHKIMIPSPNNLSSVVCLCHEFFHFIFHAKDNDIRTFQYIEILSIYAEKVASHILSTKIEPSTEKKIETIRLECIKWHYTKSKEDAQDIKNIIKKVQSEEAVRFGNDNLIYGLHLSQSYGIGYIYAEYLYQQYLDNPKLVSEKLLPVLYGEQPLSSLLNYYNISTNNKEVFEVAKKKIRTI